MHKNLQSTTRAGYYIKLSHLLGFHHVHIFERAERLLGDLQPVNTRHFPINTLHLFVFPIRQ